MDTNKYYILHVLGEDGAVKTSMYVGKFLGMHSGNTWEFMDDDDTVRSVTDHHNPPRVHFEEVKE